MVGKLIDANADQVSGTKWWQRLEPSSAVLCGIVLEARRYDLIHRRSKRRAFIGEGVSFGRSSLAVLAAKTSQITV